MYRAGPVDNGRLLVIYQLQVLTLAKTEFQKKGWFSKGSVLDSGSGQVRVFNVLIQSKLL